MKADFTEIGSILKQEISQYKSKLEVSKVGRVVELADGIARIYGLDDAMVGEVLEFENDVFGEAFNLEEESIGAVIYGDYTRVREGSDVRVTGRLMSVPVSEEVLGRVLNPLCEPIDGGPPIKTSVTTAHRNGCTGNCPASARQAAASDGAKKHRLDDSYRTRSA